MRNFQDEDDDILMPMYRALPKSIGLVMVFTITLLGIASEWFLRVGRNNLNYNNTFAVAYRWRNFLDDKFTITEAFYMYVCIYILLLILVGITVYINIKKKNSNENIFEEIVNTYIVYYFIFVVGSIMPLMGYTARNSGYLPQYVYRGFFDISYPHDFVIFIMISVMVIIICIYIYSYIMDEVLYKRALFTISMRKFKKFYIGISIFMLIYLIFIKWTS